MKILHLSSSDVSGGASKSAYRIHRSLLSIGVESHMLVARKYSEDGSVHEVKKNIRQRVLAALGRRISIFLLSKYNRDKHQLFSVDWMFESGSLSFIRSFKPDLVHIHWVDSSVVSLGELSRIPVPIVISLHDMWHFTGGCHYNKTCRNFEEQCGQCSALASFSTNDLSRKALIRKISVYSKITVLSVVGSSQWIASEAKRSKLFKDRQVCSIPTPVDNRIFRKYDRIFSRQVFALPPHKKLVLFGAMNPLGDPRKGFHLLGEALARFSADEIDVVILGATGGIDSVFPFSIHYIGTLSDEISMAVLYSSVDVVIVPSLQENLSNMIIESISCGTPVVAFDIGGNGDIINHKSNGYLARKDDSRDLYTGINFFTANREVNSSLSFDEKRFSFDVVANQYKDHYISMISGTGCK